MTTSNKKLTGFCTALLLSTWSTASVGADNTAVMCYYEMLTSAYDYLTACDVKISPERYEIYKRLDTALKDFVNSNSTPDKLRIYSEYEENQRERTRLIAKKGKCQGEDRQAADYLFEAWTTEQFATQLLGTLSRPHDPYKRRLPLTKMDGSPCKRRVPSRLQARRKRKAKRLMPNSDICSGKLCLVDQF